MSQQQKRASQLYSRVLERLGGVLREVHLLIKYNLSARFSHSIPVEASTVYKDLVADATVYEGEVTVNVFYVCTATIKPSGDVEILSRAPGMDAVCRELVELFKSNVHAFAEQLIKGAYRLMLTVGFELGDTPEEFARVLELLENVYREIFGREIWLSEEEFSKVEKAIDAVRRLRELVNETADMLEHLPWTLKHGHIIEAGNNKVHTFFAREGPFAFALISVDGYLVTELAVDTYGTRKLEVYVLDPEKLELTTQVLERFLGELRNRKRSKEES